jgi:hypothetical protein
MSPVFSRHTLPFLGRWKCLSEGISTEDKGLGRTCECPDCLKEAILSISFENQSENKEVRLSLHRHFLSDILPISSGPIAKFQSKGEKKKTLIFM